MADQVLVFVSHTAGMKMHPDGTSFVDGAEQAINAIDRAKAFHMAYFPAADMPPADYSVHQLSKARLFVSIIGFDYGSRVREDPGRSYTELEFDAATQLRLPRLVFLLRPEAAPLQGVPIKAVVPAQLRFRKKLEDSGATVAYFDSVADLKYQVQVAVTQWLTDDQDRARRSVAGTSPSTRSGPTPAIPGSGSAAPIGCLAGALAVAAAVGLVVWTGVAATFPPWAPQAVCEGASVKVVKASPAGFGQKGAVLDVAVQNSTTGSITIPAGRDVVAKGETGQQYAAESPGGDTSWFFPVDLQPASTRRLRLGLDGPGGTDRVTLTVAGVRGIGLPLTACRITSPPVTVPFKS